MPPKERMRYYPAVGPAIPRGEAGRSRVTHPFAGPPELPPKALDLHVLSTPPAFVLSQDQTLQENSIAPRTRSLETRGLNRHASGISSTRDLFSRCGTRTPQLKREPSHECHTRLSNSSLHSPRFPGNAKYTRVVGVCKGSDPSLLSHVALTPSTHAHPGS